MIMFCQSNLALHTCHNFPEEYEDKSRAEFFDQQTLDDDEEADDGGALHVYTHDISKRNGSSRDHAHMTSASRFWDPLSQNISLFCLPFWGVPLQYAVDVINLQQ